MDAMGGALFLDGEWESLSKMFSTEQDLSFEHLLTQNSDPTKNNLPDDQCLISLLMGDHNSNYFSQTCSSDVSNDDSSNGGGNHLMQPNSDDQMSCLSSFDYLVEDSLLMSQLGFPAIMDTAAADPQPLEKKNSKYKDDEAELVAAPKKRARVTKQVGKRKKKVEAVEEEANVQNSTGDLSDNDSNASQEVINETVQKEILNMNGKRRASRGAATDPQSLYARKRRERINERLRILQTLVPNGTKVDISTMLEEAVNYVKFLQLQIKLLSSDEMWMYAPLAYSGFDMGFYSKFSPYLLRQ